LSTQFRAFKAVSRRANLPRSSFVRPLPFILPLYFATCLTLAAPVSAQQPLATQQPPSTLVDGRGTWDFGAFLGGGTGAGKPSSITFPPQLAAGFHWFVRAERAVDGGLDVVHHSDASIGDHNPGYNADIFFTVGYSWYKLP